MTLRLFLAGAEVPSHRKVLAEVGAPHIALSYVGLTRRIKHPDRWAIEEKFPAQTKIFLDSGAYTVNKADAAYTQGDLRQISEAYQAFVAQNLDRVDMVSEFDALALGRDWISIQRDDFYSDLPPEKFLPIWHPEWGLEYLGQMADWYPRIGVPATSMSGRNLAPFLNSLVQDKGILLHGVAMTQVDEMSAIRWDSVSSTSWISPQQYGDTIVWTGRELKRYPKKYKDQARKRYRTLFDREGFDAQKIESDDSTELLRLSVWSWQQLVNDIEKKQRRPFKVVDPHATDADERFVDVEGEQVDTSTGEMRKPVTTVAVPSPPPTRRATTPLPVLGVSSREEEVIDPETGEKATVTVSDVKVRSDSQRKCDTCFLASKCPAFEPNSTCAFDIPIKIETKSEFIAVQNSLIEMQAQRVMFMRFAEETEGGYADPNLSAEMDRLQKMLKTKNDMEQEGFSFKIEGKAVGGQQGQPGMLARLFGDQASRKAQELPGGPIQVESAVEIIDAELIDKP